MYVVRSKRSFCAKFAVEIRKHKKKSYYVCVMS